MSYEFYKITHIIFLLVFVASTGIAFFIDQQNKQVRIAGMISSFLMLVAGFGLLARLGIHQWPTWVIAKLIIWLILAILGPILARRLKQNRIWAFRALMILFAVGVIVAVLKPA
ncbi:MAG: SirB2 family protein [Bdellovibrionales bacterium]|nr:SirB2 family protein [Bdellovibrionales bacterium]